MTFMVMIVMMITCGLMEPSANARAQMSVAQTRGRNHLFALTWVLIVNCNASKCQSTSKAPWCQGPEALSVHRPSSVRRQRGADNQK